MLREFDLPVRLLCTTLAITSLGCNPSSSVVDEPADDTAMIAEAQSEAGMITEAQSEAALVEQEKAHAGRRFSDEQEIQRLRLQLDRLRDVVAALRKTNEELESQIAKHDYQFFENGSIEVLMNKTITLHSQGEFEIVIEDLKDKASLPLKVNFADWAEAEIPRIRRIEINRKASVHVLLVDILRQANLVRVDSIADPQMQAVYVVAPADTPEKGEIVITTRKRAAERGILPKCFGP